MAEVTENVPPETVEMEPLPQEKEVVVADGEKEPASHFKQLTWLRLAIVLITESIALGALSLPQSFDSLGMIAGVILTVGIGLVTIYTSEVVGQVCLAYPHIGDYPEICALITGNQVGYWLCAALFIILLVLLDASHALTGSIALSTIAQKPNLCELLWSGVSAVVLFLVALPRTFTEMSILGFIDFVSIMAAILITMIATGIEASNNGGLSSIQWASTVPDNANFISGVIAVTNICFAFSFAVNQPSFQAELKIPTDFRKAVWALGAVEEIVYVTTGAIIYAFVGYGVKSPALLSSSLLLQRIAFGVALPVIYISGAINCTACARFIHSLIFRGTPHANINTAIGVVSWVGIVFGITVIGWVIAEVIPFFNDLLSIISSLCMTAFSFWLPGAMWFKILRPRTFGYIRYVHDFMSLLAIGIGAALTGCGTYASVESIIQGYQAGTVGKPFQC